MIRIRPLAAPDRVPILAVAAASPEAARWNREAYALFLRGPRHGDCLVAEAAGAIAGFICFRVTSDEAEVLNLAGIPAARPRGLGLRLLAEVIHQSCQRHARRMFLEARETNRPAIRFYERRGFRIAARRRGYYSDPPADALVLARELSCERPSG